MSSFKREGGDWTRYRGLAPHEVDFHYGRRDWDVPYWEAMDEVRRDVMEALKQAQLDGSRWVLFRHGASTSRMGATTARSVVRGVMRSSAATPYICRRDCIQHDSVFLASIRSTPARGSSGDLMKGKAIT